MDGGIEEAEQDSDGETLQKEYDKMTDTLNKLKRRREELLRENDFLQNEANQTCLESQAYMSYLSKQTQKCQSLIVTLSEQNQQELEALKKQREKTLAEYQEQANEVSRLIQEKEGELAMLNTKTSQLGEFKDLKQQQLGRIAELEKEVARMRRQHLDSLRGLKAGFLSEKQRYESQAKHRVQAEALAANREASDFLQSYTRTVSEENQRLRAELQQLIQRTDALKTRQCLLQAQRQELLLDRECATTFKRLCISKKQSKDQKHFRTQSEDQKHPKTPSEGLELPSVQSERQAQPKIQLKDQANSKTPKAQAEKHPKIEPRGRQTPKTHPAGQARPDLKPTEKSHSKTKPGGKPQSQPKPQGGSRA
ncbi:coiled-coil domain-containing protein 166 [Centroberyx gerrardi]|uniref:coiled-coil domain-containing protein 166 n=1 Tax=Centroberyx gerrardi TaxID=166262 RepID=UPI003AB0829E